jgi:WD40 repeat protein
MMQSKRKQRWGLHSACLYLLLGVLAAGPPAVCVGQEAEPGVRREGDNPVTKAPARKDMLGDPLLPGAVARFGTTRLRHWGTVTFVAFLPDNKTLISVGHDKTIRTWDVTTGKELAAFEVKESTLGEQGAHALAADGKTLLSAYTEWGRHQSEGFRRWDVTTGKPPGELIPRKVEGTFCPAFVSPDGSLLATGHPGRVCLWDAASFRLVRELTGVAGQCRGLSFSPDGKHLVACGDWRPNSFKEPPVAMWEVATGRQLWRAGGPQPVLSVVFLPDGKTVAAGGDAEGSTTLYDAATGKEKGVLRTGGSRLASSPDGKILAIACVPTAAEWPAAYRGACAVCLWDLATNKAAQTLVGSQHVIYAMAFSPNGKTLAAGCGDGALALWDVASGRRLHVSPGHEFSVLSVAYAPDGKTVASRGDDRVLRLWDPTNGKQKERLELVGLQRESAGWDAGSSLRQSLAYSPDGKRLACLHGLGEVVRVWDTATGRIQFDLKVPKAVTVPVSRARCLAFAPDGKTLVCGDEEGVLHVYDLATGEAVQHLDFQPGKVRDKLPCAGLAFSPDGKTLAGAYFNKVIRLWDMTSGTLLPNELTSFAFGFHFWDDGRILIAGDANRTKGPVISLFDVKTGATLRTLRGHEEADPGEGKCMGLTVSPDGQLLASGSQDRTVRVWELATGQEVLCLKGHQRPVLTVAFSPDGKQVVSGSRDTTALVWDLYPSKAQGATGPVEPLTAEQSKELWDDLADKDARRAFNATVVLTRYPAETLSLLEGKLRPAVPPDPAKLEKALKDLDAEEFTVREAASAALLAVGRPARPALERALAAGPSADVRRRLEEILEHFRSAPLEAEVLRPKRAIRVLEFIGSEQARRLLEALSKGQDAVEQTLHARAAMERIKKRSADR